MNDYITKICEFCGSAVLCLPNEEAEDACKCGRAKHRQEMREKQGKLQAAIEMCCGESCEEFYPLHKPLKEEELTALIEIVNMICSELIYSATLTLMDGTSLKLSESGVERKATSKRKESI